MPFTFYILYSAFADKYYVGFTGNGIVDRIPKHNSNHKGFTGKYKDWILAYSETYTTKTEALNREKKVKAWKSKDKIVSLIGSVPPGS